MSLVAMDCDEGRSRGVLFGAGPGSTCHSPGEMPEIGASQCDSSQQSPRQPRPSYFLAAAIRTGLLLYTSGVERLVDRPPVRSEWVLSREESSVKEVPVLFGEIVEVAHQPDEFRPAMRGQRNSHLFPPPV